MRRNRLIPGFCGVALAVLLVIRLPATAEASRHPAVGAHHLRPAAAQPAFIFGRRGGNIRPLSVTIDDGGQVSGAGSASGQNAPRNLTPDVAKGLLKLAEAEEFFSMPASTACPGVLPDVGTLYVTINTTSGAKTVSVHGGCNASFSQLWGVLAAATGVW